MGIALSGIGGFDTQNIVKQLMYLERKSGSSLYDKKNAIETTVKSYQSLNSQIAALTTNAWSVYGKEYKLDQTYDSAVVWGAAQGKANNSQVQISTEAGASIGSVEFDVKSLAQSKQVTFDAAQLSSLMSDAAGKDGYISIAVGDRVTAINPASNSIQDVAQAINSVKDSGVAAAAIRVGDNPDGTGKYVLQITGKETGTTQGDFKIFAGDISKNLAIQPTSATPDAASRSISYKFADAATMRSAIASEVPTEGRLVRASADAVISLYGEDHSYSSNNIELMDKVKVDISAVKQETKADGSPVYLDYLTKGVRVDVIRDDSVASEKVESLIDSVNKVFNLLSNGMKSVEKTRQEDDGTTTRYKAPGVLSNSVGRQIQDQLSNVISGGVSIAGENGAAQTYSLADYGIDLKLNGSELSLSFDKAKFGEMMKADPNKTETIMTAFAEKIADTASGISDSTDGMLTQVIKTSETETSYYDERINEFEDRMVTRQANLQRQYSALETLLASYSQKQSWLTSQLASLNFGK